MYVPGADPQDHNDAPEAPAPGAVTRLLQDAAAGDRAAHERLIELVYYQLHSIARSSMRRERDGHTLQPTAVVHEVYVRLLRFDDVPWQSRAHFFHAAVQAMRKLLIDHARARNAEKRGAGRAALQISHVTDALSDENSGGLLALDEAIERLGGVHVAAADVVRLRFYADLKDADVAAALQISERTVRREWAFARAWLRDYLQRELGESE